MALLDELSIALHRGYLSLDRVLDDLQARTAMQDVVDNGPLHPQALIKLAGYGKRDEGCQARLQ